MEEEAYVPAGWIRTLNKERIVFISPGPYSVKIYSKAELMLYQKKGRFLDVSAADLVFARKRKRGSKFSVESKKVSCDLALSTDVSILPCTGAGYCHGQVPGAVAGCGQVPSEGAGHGQEPHTGGGVGGVPDDSGLLVSAVELDQLASDLLTEKVRLGSAGDGTNFGASGLFPAEGRLFPVILPSAGGLLQIEGGMLLSADGLHLGEDDLLTRAVEIIPSAVEQLSVSAGLKLPSGECGQHPGSVIRQLSCGAAEQLTGGACRLLPSGISVHLPGFTGGHLADGAGGHIPGGAGGQLSGGEDGQLSCSAVWPLSGGAGGLLPIGTGGQLPCVAGAHLSSGTGGQLPGDTSSQLPGGEKERKKLVKEHLKLIEAVSNLTIDPHRKVDHKSVLVTAAKRLNEARLNSLKYQDSLAIDDLKAQIASCGTAGEICKFLWLNPSFQNRVSSLFSSKLLEQLMAIGSLSGNPLKKFPVDINTNIYADIVNFALDHAKDVLLLLTSLTKKNETPISTKDVIELAFSFSSLAESVSSQNKALQKIKSITMKSNGLTNAGLDAMAAVGATETSRTFRNDIDLLASISEEIVKNYARNNIAQFTFDNLDICISKIQHHLTLNFLEFEQNDTSHFSTDSESKDEMLSFFSLDTLLLKSPQNLEMFEHFKLVTAHALGRLFGSEIPGLEWMKSVFPKHYDHPNSHIFQQKSDACRQTNVPARDQEQ